MRQRSKKNKCRWRYLAGTQPAPITKDDLVNDPYVLLAEAIILRAFQDLGSRSRYQRECAEKFLRSEYAKTFTDLDLLPLIDEYKEALYE